MAQKIRYSQQKLQKFKQLITEKLNRAVDQLDKLKTDRSRQKRHLADTNLDFNENSKHFQQQAKNQRHIRRLQRKSRALKAALSRIEDGNYGICERTGTLIREERLEAMPTATFEIQP